MIAEQRLYLPILLFIYLSLFLHQYAISQPFNSTVRLSTFWVNRPSILVNSTGTSGVLVTPILIAFDGNNGRQFLCGFYCYQNATVCLFSILLFLEGYFGGETDMINSPQLVWSANRNHSAKTNATLHLGQDGNLVLKDSNGTPVWSTNTTDKSVSGLKITDRGNLVLFDKRNHTIWQSFDHPTDCLLPGQKLMTGRKLISSVSASNHSFSCTVLNGSMVASIDTNPPQYYIASSQYDYSSPFYDFYGRTFTALQDTHTSETQFIKLDPDGHLRVYQLDALVLKQLDGFLVPSFQNALVWKQLDELLVPGFENCGYPMVCGRYSICKNDGQCNCPLEGNFFSPIKRNPSLGCSQLTSISCNSLQYHSLIELKETTYFAFETNYKPNSSIWFEGTKMEDCKFSCLSNCSCKAAVWSGTLRKNCLLLNEVFSLMDNWSGSDKTKVFLKVQNSVKAQYQSPNISQRKQSRSLKVIVASSIAALMGITSIITWFLLF